MRIHGCSGLQMGHSGLRVGRNGLIRASTMVAVFVFSLSLSPSPSSLTENKQPRGRDWRPDVTTLVLRSEVITGLSIILSPHSLDPISTPQHRPWSKCTATVIAVVVFSLSHLLPLYQLKMDNNEDEARGHRRPLYRLLSFPSPDQP